MDDILEYLSNKLEDFDIKKLIFPTILLLMYIAGFVYFLTIIKNINKKIDKKEFVHEESHTIIQDDIYVDVKGSVQNPGVYKLDSNSRVIDQTCPIMIQELKRLFVRKPLISIEI